jgi:hypothetical protein
MSLWQKNTLLTTIVVAKTTVHDFKVIKTNKKVPVHANSEEKGRTISVL